MRFISLTLSLVLIVFFTGCSDAIVDAETETDAPVGEMLGKSTAVPGHQSDRYDTDDNGFPDEGVYVNGHYTSVYAYDANGDYYWDLGDGRVQGTVGAVDDLDSETATVCNYQITYRADFGNDPFMDAGWITNNINCSGHDDNGAYNYLIVHETDPRYTGNPDRSVWNTWEYQVLTQSGEGNILVTLLTGPQNNVGS